MTQPPSPAPSTTAPPNPPAPTPAARDAETRVLPPWLYPSFFWGALPLLLLGTFVPGWEHVGIWYMMLVPTLAAVIVAVSMWRKDRRVSLAALMALAGLALVVVLKSFL